MNIKICLLNLALFSVITLSAQNKMGTITDLEIDGPVIVKLIQGTDVGVKVIKEEDLVRWEVNGESLVIIAQYRKNHDTPEIEVTINELEALATTGSVILEGEGEFATRRMGISISAQSIVSIDVDVETLNARLKAQSILNLSGNADDFTLAVDTQSIANAGDLSCSVINVSANHQSVANVNSNGASVSQQSSNQSIVVVE